MAIEISKSNYQDYCSLDIVAFSYAAPGAMGEGGSIYIITDNGSVYHTNIVYGDMTLEDAFLVCPPLRECRIGYFDADPATDWSSFYMGAGNFLFVTNRMSWIFKEYSSCWEDYDLYPLWIYLVQSFLKIETITKRIRDFILSRWKLGPVHGVSHWDRVYRNGFLLLTNEVNPVVVGLFAYLHDSCRENDGTDIKHGPRAVEFIDSIRNTYLSEVPNEEIELLKEACRLHTTTLKTGNPTIDACFDADRLDLWRIGIEPDPEKMATEKGKELAENSSQRM